MANYEITVAAIGQLTSQSELVVQMATLITCSIPVLLIAPLFIGATGSMKVKLKGYYLAVTSAILSGLAILFGYLLHGAILQMTPQLMEMNYDYSKKFLDQETSVGGLRHIWLLSLLQFVCFFLSTMIGVVFALKNKGVR